MNRSLVVSVLQVCEPQGKEDSKILSHVKSNCCQLR